MTNIRKLLAANIKTCRNEAGLTQSKLAELADTATHYIAMIEGGKNFPSPEMIERIAFALGKDSADLFALEPIQNDWKEMILSDIDKLISRRLDELKSKTKPSVPPNC
jgi:transcriptional regulator with XRE-family HTH domain